MIRCAITDGKGLSPAALGRVDWVQVREKQLAARVLTEMVRESGALQQKGIPVPRALLLYGPPGPGKTQIARTLAKEAGVAFIARSTAELKGQYLGQAASRIAQSFESARANSPAILPTRKSSGFPEPAEVTPDSAYYCGSCAFTA